MSTIPIPIDASASNNRLPVTWDKKIPPAAIARPSMAAESSNTMTNKVGSLPCLIAFIMLTEPRLRLNSRNATHNAPASTTLLAFPRALEEFEDYLQFLYLAQDLLADSGLEGLVQLASFHPHYQFSGTEAEAAENYTNRSPYPLLHILREQIVEKALASYPNPEQIPERNIALMNKMGTATLQQQLQAYFKD